MIQLELHGKPVPWSASRTNKGHHYDPKAKDKEFAKWQIRAQYRDKPITGFVYLYFTFFFEPPKSASRIQRKEMLSGRLIPTVSDTTNLQKMYEDCLKGIVIEDDRYVSDISSSKRYSEKPGVFIRIVPRAEALDVMLCHSNLAIKV